MLSWGEDLGHSLSKSVGFVDRLAVQGTSHQIRHLPLNITLSVTVDH